ncbi:MAG: SUMF1/EgtB/PvdO family nonheme iron enzyme [Bacteroidales bacterium]|nr:SUMF1/EgtB/PvdO family nonheme iron enzyme [Bacteroidales bacterium]
MKKITLLLTAIVTLAVLCVSCAKESHYMIDEVVNMSNDSESVNIMKQHIAVPGTGQTVDLVVILKGSFVMGAEPQAHTSAGLDLPQHNVTISKDYAMAVVPVTQALYEAVMDTNPARTWAKANPALAAFLGDDKPAVWISYDDAELFCQRLSAMTGKNFSLPTEAQWEYAARGGHVARRVQSIFSGSDLLDTVGWYTRNTPLDTVLIFDTVYDPDLDSTLIDTTVFTLKHVMPVGKKMPNILDIYDMSGNAWEWCRGYYYDYSQYQENGAVDPTPLEPVPSYVAHVRRGGSWQTNPERCFVSYRFLQEVRDTTFVTDSTIGFRVVMELE